MTNNFIFSRERVLNSASFKKERKKEEKRREEKRREEKRREEKREEKREKDKNKLSDINLAYSENSWNNLSIYFMDNEDMACRLPGLVEKLVNKGT